MLIVTVLRNGLIGKNKSEIKAKRQKENEKRLLKDKLYNEYLEKNGEE
jgi:hypothetical protein